MRRSFGSRGGMGGGMLRTVGRAVGAGVGGVQEALSASASRPTTHNKPTSNILSLSSSSLNLPVSTTSTAAPTWPSCSSYYLSDGDEWEWEPVNGAEDEVANGFYDKFVFGSVPSKDEVEDAVSSLQQVLAPALHSHLVEDRFPSSSDKDVADQIASPTVSELDWIEPSLHFYNPTSLQPHQCGRVHDAFHLLQTEPSIQRMVISLSSDKAVWDAVLNNEVVRELRESLCAAENADPQSSGESPNIAASILGWILDNTKARFMELIKKLTKFVNEVFQPPKWEKTTAATTDLFEDKLRSSLLVSVVVLLIVVVTRARRA